VTAEGGDLDSSRLHDRRLACSGQGSRNTPWQSMP